MQSKGPRARSPLEDERALAAGEAAAPAVGNDPLDVAGQVPAAAAAAGGLLDERVEALRACRAHRLAEVRQVLLQARVAARLQEVGADRDRRDAVRDEVGEVPGVGAAAEADRNRAVELVVDEPGERERERVERPPRHVHHLLVRREDGAVVDDLEGVRELHAELAAGGAGRGGEPLHHREGVLELRVVPERGIRDLDAVAERAVQEPAEPLGAEERRVELHPGVDADLLEEVPRDPLDLRRRAAVHRREGDVLGEGGRDLDVADAGPDRGDRVDRVGKGILRVAEGGDELLDAGALDPLQVVADAHVEERPGARQPELLREGVDEDPRLEVLVERLLELQLLRPLAVEGLVGRVDAGPAHLELVEDLDRLQLDEPGAAEPARDDVLRELAVGSGGDAEGRRELPAEETRGEPGLGPGDTGFRDPEDRVARLELAEHPPREELERDGTEGLFHDGDLLGRRRSVVEGLDHFVPTKTLGKRARNAAQCCSSRVSRHSPILWVFCSMPGPKPSIAGYL